ncbi:MraY family glycosyltransferase [Margalitia sp. FSL K6-0131]|uniref:MraY family glycosyltransferase n=1 Tax=Margalitia sp. FSL K6-0131 TaxID=2954604 RepID=UPI0030FC709C
MLYYIFSFMVSCGIVLILIPPLKNLAFKIGFVDNPQPFNDRKTHQQPIPLLAGVAIFFSFTITYFLFIHKISQKSLGILLGSLLILIIGMIDDWYKTQGKEFRAFPKFIVQISAAIIVYFSGITFKGFTNPFNDHFIVLPEFLQFLLTIVWIFGVSTVINFTDGIDGLAAGLTAISGGTLFIVAIVQSQQLSAMMSIIIVGSALGYLRFNKPPAKMFMGDAGATFLGFILGIIALDGALKQATVLSLFIPILALGVPIFDNIRVILFRYLKGIPVYKADASQVHFVLLRKGLKKGEVLLFLCLVNVCFGLISIILSLLGNQ